ncbi:MAG: hypothetical protein JW786_09415 [Desulfobacterales bacterium]|nr:hypothetical protein [Desulfobacterales bacterium]
MLPREDLDVKKTAKTETDQSVENIIENIQKEISETTTAGWIYLGTFKEGKWQKATIEVGNQMAEIGAAYQIMDDVYLRNKKPAFPLYKLGQILGVVKVGETIKIMEIDEDVGKNRVWAKVAITSR